MIRILVVDNEKELLDLVEMHLTEAGMEVSRAGSGFEAIGLLRNFRFDLVILDIMMDEMDGFSVLKRIREEGGNMPVILLSAKHEPESKVYGLTLGADDYVTKPFSPAELVARVQAHIRRAAGTVSVEQSMTYAYGGLTLNPAGQVLFKNDRPIPLSALETKIMLALMKRPNRPISRPQLFEEAWGHDNYDENSINVYINLLRKKIEDDPREPKYIQTVWGVGYILKGDPS
jgi:two-component system alkaline phosphatase synthesis response regulator PhoP